MEINSVGHLKEDLLVSPTNGLTVCRNKFNFRRERKLILRRSQHSRRYEQAVTKLSATPNKVALKLSQRKALT